MTQQAHNVATPERRGLRAALVAWLIDRSQRRPPDQVIGGHDRPYLMRWHLIPRNPLANAYLHLFLRSDDDRALHCHPWANCSVLLHGRYLEHTEGGGAYTRHAGDVVVRPSGRMAHRIELTHGPCWTLFLTGPRYRHWYFHCPQGLVHWREFTDPNDPGAIGPGCDA